VETPPDQQGYAERRPRSNEDFLSIEFRHERWPRGRRKWAERGIKGDAANDPFLCEIIYRWYAPKWGGHILDAFAGDATNGVVAAYSGYRYTGVVLWPEQVKANEARLEAIRAKVEPQRPKRADWVCGGVHSDQLYDLIFSVPPCYFGPLFDGTYEDFLGRYEQILRQAVARLKDNQFLFVVVGDTRDDYGTLRCFPDDISLYLDDRQGLGLYAQIMLLEAVPVAYFEAAREEFRMYRKQIGVPRSVLGFWKGDPKKIRSYFKTLRKTIMKQAM
jgi:hypothetical protein